MGEMYISIKTSLKHSLVTSLITGGLLFSAFSNNALAVDAQNVNTINLNGVGNGCYGIIGYCSAVDGYARASNDPNATVGSTTLVDGLNTGGTTATGVGNSTGVTTINGSLTDIQGATSVGGTLGVTGLTDTAGLTNAGNLNQTGTTRINTSGSSATTIGNTSGGNVAIQSGGTASVTNTLGKGLTVTNTGSTTLSGGTNTSTWTLQDTNAAASGGIPAGTSLTTSGSGGGTTTQIQVTSGATSTNGANLTLGNSGSSQITSMVGGASSVTSSNSGNIITTGDLGANEITGGAGNTVTATTGNNTLTATAGSNIINANAASQSNTLSATGAGGSNNLVAPTNNIGLSGSFATTNNVGTNAAFSSQNNIGNTNSATTINSYAANTSQVMQQNSATTLVGNQALGTGTQSIVSATAAGAQGFVVVNNGGGGFSNQIQTGLTNQATAGVAVINSNGNVNGVVANQSQAVLSGGNGTGATSLTMSNNVATFGNAASGQPIRVTGVADGTQPYDAVNYRQLQSVASGVAGSSAMANIPLATQGKTFSVGVGLGSYMGQNSLALGGSIRVNDYAVVKASVATSNSNNGYAAGSSQNTVYGLGGALSF